MKITDLLADLNIPFRRHGESPHVTDGWIGLHCPWCVRGTTNYGLGIHLQTGRMSCWVCGGHNLAQYLAHVKGIPYGRARELAGGLDRVRRADAPPRGKLVLPDGVGELGRVHRAYLAGRGFDPDELAERWKLGGIGLAAHLAWRIFIPVHQGGEVVSWTTRAVADNTPHTQRYRGARRDQEIVPRGDVLYGEQFVRHGVVVHEGPTDVWATGPGAVCTCGTGFGWGQVRRLSRYTVRVVAFDNEPAAQKRARALADQLSPFPGSTLVVRLSGKDAATTPRTELAELRKRYLE